MRLGDRYVLFDHRFSSANDKYPYKYEFNESISHTRYCRVQPPVSLRITFFSTYCPFPSTTLFRFLTWRSFSNLWKLLTAFWSRLLVRSFTRRLLYFARLRLLHLPYVLLSFFCNGACITRPLLYVCCTVSTHCNSNWQNSVDDSLYLTFRVTCNDRNWNDNYFRTCTIFHTISRCGVK